MPHIALDTADGDDCLGLHLREVEQHAMQGFYREHNFCSAAESVHYVAA